MFVDKSSITFCSLLIYDFDHTAQEKQESGETEPRPYTEFNIEG
jgi:hypothetical protein